MASLSGKVIVITGASSGIGKALAEGALSRGAFVCACARSIENLKASFQNAPAENLLLQQADVSAEADCIALINATIEKWGRVDVLINNAGVSMRALFEDVALDVVRELMDINFWGAVFCTKAAMPFIIGSKGVVAGISSIAGYRGLPGRTGYSASKFALQGFLEALRTEMLPSGVHVMWVSPGFTSSNIRNTAKNANGETQKETPLKESKLMTAEACAHIILNAIEKRKRSLIITTQGKLTVLLNRFFPRLADKLVYKHFLAEPGSPLQKKHPTKH